MSYFHKRRSMGALGATVAPTLGTPSYDCGGTPCDSNGNPLPPSPTPTAADQNVITQAIQGAFGWALNPAPAVASQCARVVPSVDGTTTECVDANGNVVGTVDPTTGAVSGSGFPVTSVLLLGGLGLGAYFLLRRKK